MAEPLLQLTYISDIPPTLSPADIVQIHQQAEINNQRLALTGLLLHTKRHFMQLLEGPAAVVHARYEIIAADPRHQHVRVISERPIPSRQFPNWHMGLKRLLDQDEDADLTAVINLYGQQQHFSPQHAEAIALLFQAV